MIGSVINIVKPMSYGEFTWSDATSFKGSVWIRVDLKRQILSVFRGYDEIGTSVIVYGSFEKSTPLGIFHVLAMYKEHRSTLYDAFMPYTLRITADGVAIHGSHVSRQAATHGCVGIPVAFAARLFEAVHVGDAVLIY